MVKLNKIYTRTGDGGSAGLVDGSRVSKSSLRMTAIGEVDEANAAIGVAIAALEEGPIPGQLREIQNDLFDLGGEISIPGHTMLGHAQVTRLDAAIEQWNAELPPLKEFILPGGTRAAALAHLARTVCRRAERSVVALGQKDRISAHARRYLNRLSDLLFVVARILNRHAGRSDVQWRHERNKPSR